jgi:hypothetical protein
MMDLLVSRNTLSSEVVQFACHEKVPVGGAGSGAVQGEVY